MVIASFDQSLINCMVIRSTMPKLGRSAWIIYPIRRTFLLIMWLAISKSIFKINGLMDNGAMI